MIYPTSRIEQTEDGILFYEQDVLFDDYVYVGNLDIELTIDYNNVGFGLMIINSEGSSLKSKDEFLMFKIGNKNAEVIYKDSDIQTTLANYNCVTAKTCTKDIKIKIIKRGNIYIFYVGGKKISTYKSKCDIESFNLGYYSNKDNVIKSINIASAVPYSWIVNMENTNGGYIEFMRDGFLLKECNGEAEIGQINLNLVRGEYFLKSKRSEGSDIKSYVFESSDPSIIDDEKNILKKDGSFFVESNKKITIKFKGTKGSMSKIAITRLKDNEYVRTSPDTGDFIEVDGSYIKFILPELQEFSFKGKIFYVPGLDHTSPLSYQIMSDGIKNYGLYDTNIALNTEYDFRYKDEKFSILKNGRIIKEIKIIGSVMTIFKNINAVITDLVVKDKKGNDDTIIVENTIKKSVPGVIKSPIVVTDKKGFPLDLSASYRYFYKNNKIHYVFTNKEREYFKPSNVIKLKSMPSYKSGSIIAYGIKKDSRFELDRILEIEKEGKDTIDACADLYDILFESDLKYIDKFNHEIRISDVSDYQIIIVDYLKENSYCINYRYEHNSYEVDISSEDGKNVNIMYDNTEKDVGNIEYINEKIYLDTKMIPSSNCYIVLGR